MKIIRKVPDLQENFIERSKSLLNDKNHGVLLCTLTLIIDMCTRNPNIIKYYRPVRFYFYKANINLIVAYSSYFEVFEITHQLWIFH